LIRSHVLVEQVLVMYKYMEWFILGNAVIF